MATSGQSNLTLTRLRRYVYSALGDATTDASDVESASPIVANLGDIDDIINDAGRFFFAAHTWKFRERPPVTLNFVANTPYIILPEDFGELTSHQMSNSLNYHFTMTSMQQIINFRSTTVDVTLQHFWGALAFPASPTRSEPPPPPRIELFPQPSTAVSDVMTVAYRAKWMELIIRGDSTTGAVDDVAQVPTYAHMSLIQCVRAFAMGLQERLFEPKGGIEGILDRILNGPIWKACMLADSMVQNTYGVQGGGAIQSRYPFFTWKSRSSSPVANPS